MEGKWPVKLTLNRDDRILRIDFDDGAHFDLPCEYLRVESPSAEVQGHGAAERRIVAGKRAVAIKAIEPVGNYAVRPIFDDGHDTGLYTWPYLYALGVEQEARWQAYLSALETKNLGRDP